MGWVSGSSQTYQNSPSLLKVRPSFSRSFSEMLAHSGDLESNRLRVRQEKRNSSGDDAKEETQGVEEVRFKLTPKEKKKRRDKR